MEILWLLIPIIILALVFSWHCNDDSGYSQYEQLLHRAAERAREMEAREANRQATRRAAKRSGFSLDTGDNVRIVRIDTDNDAVSWYDSGSSSSSSDCGGSSSDGGGSCGGSSD